MQTRILPAALALLLIAGLAAGAGPMVLDEEFNTLDNWTALTFPKIARHSIYTIESKGTAHYLVAKSDNSASAIRYVREFDVYRSPLATWRWKVDNVYARGDVRTKAGDDYPLRVYIMFKYDPAKASFAERAQYGLAKLLYGAYPPQSTLNYIWANRPEEHGIYPSPYTDRSRMIVLRAGTGDVGRWVEERVNIPEDYRRAFGTEPPATASIAIMNDSDNTGESATSYMDYIRVEADR